jgi:RNA polymerase sigma factor (sigma-70 family)
VSPTSRLGTTALAVSCASAPPEDPLWPLLVERLSRPVRGGVLGVLQRLQPRRDPGLMDELVQEVWCHLLERDRRALALCGAADERAVHVYVRRVASRVAIDVLRARRAQKRCPRRLAAYDELDGDEPGLLDWRESPERRLLGRERIAGLLALCRELLGPVRRAERLRIVRLAWLEGWSTPEIAARIGRWSPSAIDSMLSRLRQRLAERGVAPALRVRERTGAERVGGGPGGAAT